ncbi:MAG: hypothetical protein ACR2PY_07615 [Salinispira sp.]
MMKHARVYIIAMLLIHITQLVTAQEDGDSVLLYFVDLSDEPAGDDVTLPLVNRVVEEVTILGLPLVSDPLITYQRNTVDSGEGNAIRLNDFFTEIDAEGAGFIIAIFYSVDGSNIFIQYNLYDALTDTGIRGAFTRARTGATFFTTINDAVLVLGESVREYLSNRYEYSPFLSRVNEISITGEQEGVQVFFAGQDVGTISEGDILVPYTPFRVNDTVVMELRKEGYHSRSFDVIMDEKNVHIDLEKLWSQKRFALQSYWTLGLAQGIGFGLKMYLVPDETFAYLGMHLHDAAYSSAYKPSGSGYTSSNVNTDFSFYIGQYVFFPPESLLRLSIGVGLGVVKTSLSENLSSIKDFNDVYVSLGNPTLELNLDLFQIFARGELKYALGIGNQLLGRNWIFTPIGIPPISFGVQVQW